MIMRISLKFLYEYVVTAAHDLDEAGTARFVKHMQEDVGVKRFQFNDICGDEAVTSTGKKIKVGGSFFLVSSHILPFRPLLVDLSLFKLSVYTILYLNHFWVKKV